MRFPCCIFSSERIKQRRILFFIGSNEIAFYDINVGSIMLFHMKHLENVLLSTPIIIPEPDAYPFPTFQENSFMKVFSILK